VIAFSIYYPYTSVGSEEVLRTALLFWDLHIIVPWKSYGLHGVSRDHDMALEIIGVEHVPSDAEKREAHEILEDFATRPLPEAFSYFPGNPEATNWAHDWPVYAHKLLPETWRVPRYRCRPRWKPC
jgi:hypothetical protein